MKTKNIHKIISFILSVLIFFILNGIFNLVATVVIDTFSSDNLFALEDLKISIPSMVFGFNILPIYVYGILLLVSLVIGLFLYYKVRSNYKDLEEDGSKGTSRFTTLKELHQQYKSVPEKGDHYEGGGGVPIARHKDQIFVDDSPVNNLWIGTTRSGKGEMGMFPMIDIYSRAKKQASMILNDPKGELFASSQETLVNRGYHVEVLNLMNPLESMSYQLLQLVIDAYEEGDMAKSEQLTQTISSMFFYDPSAKEKFWQDSASSLCNALILGICEKNIKHNKHKITMYTVANTLNKLGSEKNIDEVTGEETSGLDRFFDSLPEGHPARLQYATVKFASGAGQTVAGILANAYAKLSIFTLTPIAKMTSKNSFEMKKVGFGKIVTGVTKPLSRVNIYFAKGNKVSIRTNAEGLFVINHDEIVNENDEIKIEVVDSEINLSVFVQKINENDGVIDYQIIEEKKDNGQGITLNRLEYFNKPTAIFMITPDYDSSLHVIASLYVKQLYTELARTASNTKGGKTIREVIFILDEFGNMPTIEDMGTMITVCLGRNIRFNLVIQAYSQLEGKYDKDWKTIDGNCANTIYILTTDNDTAEIVSKKLGEKTIKSKSRSGSDHSLDKNKTEGVEGRRLLDSTELRQLKEGEMVVIRGIKRQDLKKKRITPYPIFNTKNTAIKYRWEYLSEFFDTSKSINDIDIKCEHNDVELKELLLNFDYEEDLSEEGEPSQPIKEEVSKETIQGLFQVDTNALALIRKHVMEKTNLSESEFNSLEPENFLEILEGLNEKELIPENIYNVIKNKFNSLIEGGNETDEGKTADQTG